ncbi:LLM class flavin-dependent oxidoreductase [Kibdelosporangium persicum]|uniref:LLM class flavin-dependent oxidoreductase n=1 Tax=Kibdelosporangium persicum TaxID=2698649 RepID=A0ABX2FIN9_9PSEU|nr:LLM class flavin-dependent oxidoreductase [Kibdelosporangium persicum]
MRCGVSVPTFGEFADVHVLTELAVEAERAGWDGFFLWDHVAWPWVDELVDPWIAMTAVALSTERIRFGPVVTPLSRRRPAKVARETVTLDRLSGGRFTLGVGSGAFAKEFDDLGEPGTDARTRAALLDESLRVLTALWSGEKVSFTGTHHQIRDTRFVPTPVQQPRIPVWVGGQWALPGPLARALNWDGYVPLKAEPVPFTPAEVAEIAERLDITSRTGYDLVICGAGGDVAGYVEAGATWWVDTVPAWDPSLPAIRERVVAGPPIDRPGSPG